MLNVEKTIISQYANSERICTIIEKMNEWIDPRISIQQFYSDVFDIATAKGYGLDVWGRIVGIGRKFKTTNSGTVFGFETSTDDFTGFNNAPFAFSTGSSIYELSDEAYRTLIMVKAMSNIVYATAPNINALLRELFAGRGRCYYLTIGEMRGRYVFEFPLDAFEKSLIEVNGLLPRPTAVDVDFYIFDLPNTFGFQNYQPFNQGVFNS